MYLIVQFHFSDLIVLGLMYTHALICTRSCVHTFSAMCVINCCRPVPLVKQLLNKCHYQYYYKVLPCLHKMHMQYIHMCCQNSILQLNAVSSTIKGSIKIKYICKVHLYTLRIFYNFLKRSFYN